jgi:hypothetical protein
MLCNDWLIYLTFSLLKNCFQNSFYSLSAALLKEQILIAEEGSFCALLPGQSMEEKMSDVLGVIFAGFETTSNTVRV